jgi:hypothetical protein
MKKLLAIDINLNEINSSGTAYYRLTKEMKEFLEICSKENDIIGFEFEEGSFNFGVILRKKIN